MPRRSSSCFGARRDPAERRHHRGANGRGGQPKSWKGVRSIGRGYARPCRALDRVVPVAALRLLLCSPTMSTSISPTRGFGRSSRPVSQGRYARRRDGRRLALARNRRRLQCLAPRGPQRGSKVPTVRHGRSPLAVTAVEKRDSPRSRIPRCAGPGSTRWTRATWWRCSRSSRRTSPSTRARDREQDGCRTRLKTGTASRGTSTTRRSRPASMAR